MECAVFGNHDQPRSVSTWGYDQTYWDKSAKALATMYFLMQGTPFIYQGQEIGMTNVQFPSIEDYNCVGMKNFYYIEAAKGRDPQELMGIIWKTSRDNSRTPMQWSDEENGGFSTGSPWLKVNPNYKEINVQKAIQNPESIYHYYRHLIQLRKEYLITVYGSYDLILPNHKKLYAYIRTLGDEKLLVITNLFAEETNFNMLTNIKYKSSTLLISNYEVDSEAIVRKIALKPYEARVYLLK